MSQEFKRLWKQYEPFVKAVVEVFHPFVEAAVHDLEKGKIVALYHNISQRNIGDPSPLRELKISTENFPDYFSPYYKENWDGRPLKCTSITIRNKSGKPIGLICLNIDASFFQDNFQILKSFLKINEEGENPIEIFGTPCAEQIDEVIKQFLGEKNLSLHYLNRDQKKELVQHLYQKGIFNFKNAASLIAKKLNTSRATVYNYIKQIGE